MLEIQIPKNITPLIIEQTPFSDYQSLILKGKLGEYHFKIFLNDKKITTSGGNSQKFLQIKNNEDWSNNKDKSKNNWKEKNYTNVKNLLLYNDTSNQFLNYQKKHFFFFFQEKNTYKNRRENASVNKEKIYEYAIQDLSFRWFKKESLLQQNSWPKKYESSELINNLLKLYIGYLIQVPKTLTTIIPTAANENFEKNDLKMKKSLNNVIEQSNDLFLLGFFQKLKSCFIGILQGYTINLELKGIGYSCTIENNILNNHSNCKNIEKTINNPWKINGYKTFYKLNVLIKQLKNTEKKETLNKFKQGLTKTEKILKLSLGLSHNIKFEIPQNDVIITCTTLNKQSNVANKLILFGISNLSINQIGANIYKLKKPEPYKGKGIRYHSEKLFIKEKKKK